MEHLRIAVTDVMCRAGGPRPLAQIRPAAGAGGKIHRSTVADGHNAPQQIGAVDCGPLVVEAAENLVIGVAVRVPGAHGDNGIFRQDFAQKAVAGGGVASVVAHLQHRGLQIAARVHQIGLSALFHVSGEQERGFPEIHPQDNGGVVGVGIVLTGAQDCNQGVPQVIGGVHLRADGGEPLGLGVLDELAEGLGAVLADGGPHRPGGTGVQGAGEAAHMVLVGVGTHHIVQVLHPQVLQVGDEQAAVLRIAAVNEHRLPAAQQQGGVGLSHVDEMNGQSLARTGGGPLGLGWGLKGLTAGQQGAE